MVLRVMGVCVWGGAGQEGGPVQVQLPHWRHQRAANRRQHTTIHERTPLLLLPVKGEGGRRGQDSYAGASTRMHTWVRHACLDSPDPPPAARDQWQQRQA